MAKKTTANKSHKGSRVPVDWLMLKTEFFMGDCPSINKFAQSKGIGYRSMYRHATGWMEERQRHRQELASQALKKADETKVLSATKNAEYASQLLVTMLKRYQMMMKKADEIADGVRLRADKDTLMDLNRMMNQIASAIPEFMKTIELLSGRPTNRDGQPEDALQKRVAELKVSLNERRARMAKAVEVGGFTIGSVDEKPVERPTEQVT